MRMGDGWNWLTSFPVPGFGIDGAETSCSAIRVSHY